MGDTADGSENNDAHEPATSTIFNRRSLACSDNNLQGCNELIGCFPQQSFYPRRFIFSIPNNGVKLK